MSNGNQNPPLFANGSNNITAAAIAATALDEEQRARDLAQRYHCEYIDLRNYKLDSALLRKVPVEYMFRYNFVPLEEAEGRLHIAIADPSQLMMVDEIGLMLAKRIKTKVATLAQISDILKKTEQSARVLEEASEAFTLDVIREDDSGADEQISIDRLTAESDISPIIKLVDTTIFTALERRASDIHIETGDDSVVVKYRIDGVLQPAMQPIAKEHHSTIISRIKVMSELDIAERRVPQDGRFRVKYKNRAIDFRVSIMPSIHGEARTPCSACWTKSR
jgi:type IV pilus assembly protein PilB